MGDNTSAMIYAKKAKTIVNDAKIAIRDGAPRKQGNRKKSSGVRGKRWESMVC